jgi:hypothetical protein
MLKRGETKVDTLYVGIAPRTIPFPDGRAPGEKDMLYTITKDQQTVYNVPHVTLDVGITYLFVVNTPGYPFYITTDAQGGGVLRQPIQSMSGSIEIIPECTGEKGNVGMEKGSLRWTPSREHSQMKLFYQCNYYPFMGNSISVRLPE